MEKKADLDKMVVYDIDKMVVYDYSNMDLQEDSMSNCYRTDSCDSCDSCDRGGW